MRVGVGLATEQTQKLIMTPELRQAIAVLQLNTLELTRYLEQELLENPLLEIKEDFTGQMDDGEMSEREAPEEDGPEQFDADWAAYFGDQGQPGMGRQTSEQMFSSDNLWAPAPNLQEYLLFQLNVLLPANRDRRIGEFLIGNLDENGYLTCSLDEVSRVLLVNQEQVEDVLKVVQGFDPVGVGARDLAECLRIQLVHKGKLTPDCDALLRHYLQDLGNGRLVWIAQRLKITVQEVQALADLIKSLDPKPGARFSNDDVRYIVPDIVVERVEGKYVVLINDSAVPHLAVNLAYQSLLRQEGRCDPKTRKFLENKLSAAEWLIRSIEQRRLTLYRVVTCLVDLQRDFMDHGVRYLKPLNLKHVADIIGVHQSTVSRAIATKYIQTPQGVFKLKFLFGSGLACTNGGKKKATECIKRMIREMVEREDPRTPLSDREIAERLKAAGIDISRRTVAKYRDELQILATPQRRRY